MRLGCNAGISAASRTRPRTRFFRSNTFNPSSSVKYRISSGIAFAYAFHRVLLHYRPPSRRVAMRHRRFTGISQRRALRARWRKPRAGEGRRRMADGRRWLPGGGGPPTHSRVRQIAGLRARVSGQDARRTALGPDAGRARGARQSPRRQPDHFGGRAASRVDDARGPRDAGDQRSETCAASSSRERERSAGRRRPPAACWPAES